MKKFVCISCPRGCMLEVGPPPEWTVTGNACARGEVYGRSEASEPRRMVSATCPAVRTANSASPDGVPGRVPVKTSAPVPKDLVETLARELRSRPVIVPVASGTVIIHNWQDTGADIIVTRDVE